MKTARTMYLGILLTSLSCNTVEITSFTKKSLQVIMSLSNVSQILLGTSENAATITLSFPPAK
jgi:hypothetical protein